jgi:hypothetical protein
MIVNNFSLDILADQYIEKINKNNYTYFAIPDKSEYKIKMGNNGNTRADAFVYVDGEYIGTWRINTYSTIIIERPANINKKFVLLKEGSSYASKYGIVTGDTMNGLIKVVFKPEKNTMLFTNSWDRSTDRIYLKNCNTSANDNNQTMAYNYSSGGTVLGNTSSQIFDNTSPLTNIDTNNITTIYTRLVVKDNYNVQDKYMSLKNINNLPPPINTFF